MESILDKYKEELDRGDKLHITFSRIYAELFDRKADQKTFTMFGKLCKIYGKNEILLALLDMYDMDNINHNNIYPLISFFIKKRFEQKQIKRRENNLNVEAERLRNEYWRLE